jgi:hypothetical protein
MTNKLPLLIGVVTLSTLAMAGSKSYNVELSTPTKAGSAQLAPGDYKLKVEGTNAIFTDSHTRASVTVPVKVENADTKFNSTAVDTTSQGGSMQITSIELGGSKTKLEFGK